MIHKITEDIKAYIPVNEQEEKDKKIILEQLENNPLVLSRDSKLAHITVSAWVINKEHTKVLMAYHNIYNSWSWLGGHADGETNLLKVAIKEAKEESGITKVTPLSDIASIEILTVDGHIKKGQYVSSHLHLNITYILQADENEQTKIKSDENSNVAWFTFDEAIEKSTETWFKKNVYPKLVDKSKNLSV